MDDYSTLHEVLRCVDEERVTVFSAVIRESKWKYTHAFREKLIAFVMPYTENVGFDRPATVTGWGERDHGDSCCPYQQKIP